MNPHFVEILRAFRDEEVEYLVIGDFAEPEVLYQIGLPPSRIDIMTSVTGLTFDAAWPNRITAHFGDVAVPVLGLDDMRKAKRAAGRLKDLADLEELG
jgi:hypothetical protein